MIEPKMSQVHGNEMRNWGGFALSFPQKTLLKPVHSYRMFLHFDNILLSGTETAAWKLPPNTNTHIKIQ